MKRRIKHKIILSILMILSSFALFGCKKNYNVIYFDNSSFSAAVPSYTLEIVHSIEDLKILCTDKKSYTFDEESEYYNRLINEKIRTYDKEYFEKKSLIIFSYERGDEFKYLVKDVDYKDNTIIIKIKRKTYPGIHNLLAYNATVLIEIEKEQVGEINNVETRII